MVPEFCYVGRVRRIDAHLRHRYPNLVTNLYEIASNRFLIVFDRSIQDASHIESEFNDSIRFATTDVSVTNDVPSTYLRTIPPLSDAEALSHMVGLPLSRIQVLNILLSRFPDVDIVTVQDDLDEHLFRIILGKKPDSTVEAALADFADGLGLPVPVVLQVARHEAPEEVAPLPHEALFVWASRLRPHAPRHVRADEAFWFDNIRPISLNMFPPTSFPGIRDGMFRCYMDLTTGTNYMNLRQALLLYDEVWCSLPLESSHDRFLMDQALAEDDLLALVDAGRLRFVTTQPEERLNVRFLEAAYERNPLAMLGRRTTAALLVADLVQTADASRLNDPAALEVLPAVCEILAPTIGVDAHRLLRVFLWPLASRRASLNGLLANGSWGSPVADLGQVIADHLRSKRDVDVELEVRVLSPAVHIAHALNATLFGSLGEPRVWHQLQSIVGRHLNFHRHFTDRSARPWTENEMRRLQGTTVVPAIQLFEFDRRIPIQEVIDDTTLWSTRAKGRSLYARLAQLSDVERQTEITALELELRKRARQASGVRIDFDNVETAVATTAVMADFVFPPLAGLTRLGTKAIHALRRNQRIDRMIMRLGEGISSEGTERDLDFLSRISRVAAFRRDRV